MKLRNKKTGEIDNVSIVHSANKIKGVVEHEDGAQCLFAYTLKEFNKEWEDYEEPEEFWYINECGDVLKYKYDGGCSSPILEAKQIGNHFETEEEAEKAVEILKALTRLVSKGFRFDYVSGYENLCGNGFEIPITAIMPPEQYTDKTVAEDLDICFGGKE